MKKQCPGYGANGQQGPQPGGCRDEYEDGSDQFYDAGSNTTPWLHTHGLKDIHALGCPGKLKVKGLEEDRRDDDFEEECEGK